jgi:hypothetical protein
VKTEMVDFQGNITLSLVLVLCFLFRTSHSSSIKIRIIFQHPAPTPLLSSQVSTYSKVRYLQVQDEEMDREAGREIGEPLNFYTSTFVGSSLQPGSAVRFPQGTTNKVCSICLSMSKVPTTSLSLRSQDGMDMDWKHIFNCRRNS